MSRIARVVVLMATLMSLGAPTAGAVSWHNDGDTAFTATASVVTFSATGFAQQCGPNTTTGTAAVDWFATTPWPALTLTTSYGCAQLGIPFPWECRRTFTATSFASGVTSGFLDTTCETYQQTTPVCQVTGTQPATYTNPNGLLSTTGRLALAHWTTLRIFNAPGHACVYGNGSTLTLSDHTFTITTATGGPAPHTGPSFRHG